MYKTYRLFRRIAGTFGSMDRETACAGHDLKTYRLIDMYMKRTIIALALASWLPAAHAQYAWQDGAEPSKENLTEGLAYKLEAQATVSKDKTPLWLNANKYGLSSLEDCNGYVRASLIRPLATDSARRWGIGYGLDVAGAYHFTSKPIVQQAYAELRWLHGVLTVGSKEQPMELKNNRLSSGSQTLGINARPVPQVRLALPEYWVLPFGHGWLRIKGHVAYGKMTDDGWQHEFTSQQTKYTDDLLYHSKAGYLMIGNPDRFCPLSVEMGLEMATLFGGTAYWVQSNGSGEGLKMGSGLKDYWHAFLPGGADPNEGVYGNVSGNQLGSWVMRVNYDTDLWRWSVYADHFFEDHSAMLLLDYDGYGKGDNYLVKEDRRFYLYKLKDMMLGMELNLKYGRWLRDVVVEYLYTKYQSGPYYHDHSMNIPDHLAGMDNYYNHGIYPGWQHWGQVMGNPLYRSPVYNTNGRIGVENNRFMAFHLGLAGAPTDRLDYRVLATWQDGLGTYDKPYTKKHHNVSLMVEAGYRFNRQWQVRGAYGMDFGHILGSNAGFQLTVSKWGLLKL